VAAVTVDGEGGVVSRHSGLPGVTLRPGDHLCACYFGDDERDAILLPWLEAALRDGDRAVGVVDSVTPAAVAGRLDPDLDPDGCITGRQLLLCDAAETYLRGGRFSPDWVAEFWEEQAHSAAADGYELARGVAEMSWLAREPLDRHRLVDHEAWAQRFAAGSGLVLLSLYDLARLGGGILVDLVRTHPRVLVGGHVLDNPDPLTPAEFAGAHAW